MDIQRVMPHMGFDTGRQLNRGRVTCRTGATDDIPAARVERLHGVHLHAIYRNRVLRTGLIDDDLRLGRIDTIRTVGCRDKAIIGIIRLALIGRRMTGVGLCALSGVGDGGGFTGSRLIAVPLVGGTCHVAALRFCYQGRVGAYRNGLRNRIQGVEERTA